MHAFISIYFYTIYIICCILECIKQNTVLHRYYIYIYIYVTCPEHIYIYTYLYTVRFRYVSRTSIMYRYNIGIYGHHTSGGWSLAHGEFLVKAWIEANSAGVSKRTLGQLICQPHWATYLIKTVIYIEQMIFERVSLFNGTGWHRLPRNRSLNLNPFRLGLC